MDGFIAKEDGSIDWLTSFEDDYGYEEFLSTIDAVIMGRKTYQQVLSFGEWPYKGIKSYIFTHQKLQNDRNVEFVSRSIIEEIKKIKKQSTKYIWLVGGGNLITEFVKHQLIDDFRIFIMPVFLGKGIPILQNPVEMDLTKFVKSKTYKNGVTEIYLRANK